MGYSLLDAAQSTRQQALQGMEDAGIRAVGEAMGRRFSPTIKAITAKSKGDVRFNMESFSVVNGPGKSHEHLS